MENKYIDAFNNIVFKIAELFFPDTPITKTHIVIAESWARQNHIWDIISRLDETIVNNDKK